MGCVVVSVNVCCVFYVYCRRHDYFYCHSFTTTIVGLRDIGAAGADAGALGVLTILLSSSQLQSLDSERVRERTRERLGRLLLLPSSCRVGVIGLNFGAGVGAGAGALGALTTTTSIRVRLIGAGAGAGALGALTNIIIIRVGVISGRGRGSGSGRWSAWGGYVWKLGPPNCYFYSRINQVFFTTSKPNYSNFFENRSPYLGWAITTIAPVQTPKTASYGSQRT